MLLFHQQQYKKYARNLAACRAFTHYYEFSALMRGKASQNITAKAKLLATYERSAQILNLK
jgi:hypothetical protein